MPSLAWRRSVVPLIYGALTLWLHRRLVVAPQQLLYDQVVIGHDSLLHVWALAWGQRALWSDPRHLFDGPIFHPQPGALLFSDHLLGVSILLAPLRLFTDNVVLLHNLVVIASPFVNAMAMFALARHLTQDRLGAFAAGLVYAFIPFRAHADFNQLQMLVAWWPPLILLGAVRLLETGARRWALLTGVALASQGATGIYLTAFTLPFLALAHLWWLRRFPLRSHRRAWVWLLGSEAAAALVLLPTALAYRSVQATLGSTRSPVLNALLSIPPATLDGHLALVSLAIPMVAAVAWRRHVRGSWPADVPLVLAIAGGGVLLALGPGVPLPLDGGRILGPYAFLMGLPGFTALRAPGRMLHVAAIGIALLGGGGVAAMRHVLPRTPFAFAGMLLLAGFAWQAWPQPVLVSPAPVVAPGSPHDWIRRQGISTPIAELPLGAGARTEQIYQHQAMVHWRPLLNGNMGVKPPLHGYLTRRLRAFPDDGTVGDLAALGVRWVIVHEQALSPPRRRAIERAAMGPHPLLVPRHRHGSDVVYALDGEQEPRSVQLPAPVPRDGWTVTVTENASEADRVIDADRSTAWSSWGGLERALRPWWAPEPFLTTWKRFLTRQPAYVLLDFGALEPLAAVSLRLAGSDPDAVALLSLDLSTDGTTWARSTAPLLAVPDVQRIVTHGAEGQYAFVFDRPTTARYLRVSVIGLDWRLGDVQAHRAPESLTLSGVFGPNMRDQPTCRAPRSHRPCHPATS